MAEHTDDMNDMVLLGIDRDSWKGRAERLQSLNAELVAALKATGVADCSCRVFPESSGLRCHVGEPSTYCPPCQVRAVLEKAESK